MKKPKLIVLLGPTAVGKTKLSIEIAKQWNGEIISGDSMQVYRGMDIGTAKATPQERSQIEHHLIDIKSPDEAFSVSEFKQLASEAILHIAHKGHIPIIVGGTGLYIESLCYDFQLNPVGNDNEYRNELMEYAIVHSNDALHERLVAIDPVAAQRIHPQDQRRVIRALEVYHLTGKPISDQLRGQHKESPYDLCLIGLTMDRKILYKRIEERIDQMIAQGLVEEVKSLLDNGFTADMVSMQGLGYKEIIQFIQSEYDLDHAVYLLKETLADLPKDSYLGLDIWRMYTG